MNGTVDGEALVPTRVVAEYLGCSPETVRRLFVTRRESDDAPRPVKLSGREGGRLRWSMADVVAWVERQRQGEPPQPAVNSLGQRYRDRRW